jgi:hypothetical protein
MVIITAVTNLWGLPCPIEDSKNKRIYGAFVGYFTIITSFMYHLLDSTGI